MNVYDVRGRVAVVTGGANGIGLHAAKRLLESGASVSLWDQSAERLDEAAEGLRTINGAIDVQVADVSVYKDVEGAASRVFSTYGRIDILVNSAGVSGPFARCDEYPLDAWHRQLAVNLTGVFHCCRAVLPYMLRNGYGRVVNLASMSGKEGNPMSSGYSASKAGVIGLTKTLGKEYATTGVLVNCITPALVDTPMHRASLKRMPESLMESLKAKIPMNRIGTPDEVANMIAWLASEDCSFSTGAAFDLSGGRATY